MAGVVASLGLLALGGCGQVEVARTTTSATDRSACAALVRALPGKVSDQERRETSGNPLSAAWGDPPIVLRCGVPLPSDQDLFARCEVINGIGWFSPEADSDDQSTDAVLTTVDRTPRVEVLVPAERRPPLATLVDVATAVKAHTRETRPCS